MVTNYQNGVIAQLLQAIIGQINFDGTPTSNIGDILLSILEQTPYDKEPKSVLAELFLKLKDKLEGRAFTPYDKEPITAFNGVNNVYNDSGDTSVTYLAKIADNLNATAKFRAEVKAQKEKAKEELKEDVKEDVKELEPIKDSGEKKRGA